MRGDRRGYGVREKWGWGDRSGVRGAGGVTGGGKGDGMGDRSGVSGAGWVTGLGDRRR